MTDTTLHLDLPFLMPNQAQKHVTVNESLQILDSSIQLSVVSRSELEPLAGAADGDRYLVPAEATGAFSGEDGKLAWLEQGVWRFLTPVQGWRAWVEDAQRLDVLASSGWQAAAATGLDQLGINALTDSSNRFAVASAASLFSHDGEDHRLKVNRAADTDVASILFQTGFSEEAEFGLSGAEGVALRTSPDGSAWTSRLTCPPNEESVLVPSLRAGEVLIAADAVASVPTPNVSGFFYFHVHDETFPNALHAGLFLFDSAASRMLVQVYAGSGVSSAGTGALTGATGPGGKTSISVQPGAVQIENRQTDPAVYRFGFLG